MEILEKSIMIVNYELDEITIKKDIPQSFDNYITDMTKQIAEKTVSLRQFLKKRC